MRVVIAPRCNIIPQYSAPDTNERAKRVTLRDAWTRPGVADMAITLVRVEAAVGREVGWEEGWRVGATEGSSVGVDEGEGW